MAHRAIDGLPSYKMVDLSMFINVYHLVITNSLPWKDPPFLIGEPSINGPSIPWLC